MSLRATSNIHYKKNTNRLCLQALLSSLLAKKAIYLCRLRENHIRAASATILTYGSYSLAVYNVENDIDALCAGPWFAYLTEVG
ncbi:unnamed protein product [Lactuca virosa]|uniref:Uncharacterized protein n=1 Tax=Lactuca virosa TaxID=75947 RepID=A0AAU9N3T7_9ASTR|nr:unnamed protein product [Lactuca virosa]